MPARPARTAYIRTTDEPDMSYEQTYALVGQFVRQKYPDDTLDGKRHRFLFGACNVQDAHILDIFLAEHMVPSQTRYGECANLLRSDLELRISEAHAASGAGQRVRARCEAGGICVNVSGATDVDCAEGMLRDCDYIIDHRVWENFEWFWSTARTGIPQDNLLTNSSYDMSKHDASKTRLARRYAGHGWKANSGCSHGNGGSWLCYGCGGKCKRGRCKINPPQESPVPECFRLPGKGSVEWKALSADEACSRMQMQRTPGRYDRLDMYSSIDTFSGD